MKLNGTSRYLVMIRDTLAKSIVPELQSPATKSAAELINNVLNELIRREGDVPALLQQVVAEGHAIAAEMRVRLDGGAAPAIAVGSGFNDAANAFAALCADISTMGEALWQQGKAGDLPRRAAEWEGNAHTAFLRVAVPPPTQEDDAEPVPKPALEAFLKTVHAAGDKLRVVTLDRVPGGFGKQTYMAEIDDGSGKRESLVIRKGDRSPLIDHPIFDLEREFCLLDAVSRAGYPAPVPLWFGRKGNGIDADFMVVKRMPGRVMGSFFAGPEGGKLSESQVRELTHLLAQLHRMPLETFEALIRRFDVPELLTDTTEQYTRRVVQGWRDYLAQRESLPSPLFTYLMQWLVDNVPRDERRPVLLHGDFSIHNMLADDGRVTAVLDWEGSMFGAPELDLAFVRLTLSKFLDWERFVALYVEYGGSPPREESMNYSLALYNLRVVLAGALASRNVQSGASGDLRLAMFELGLTPHFMASTLACTAPKS